MTGRDEQTKGITVSQRGSRWYYRLGLEPEEKDAWSAAMASRQRHGSGRPVRANRRTVRTFLAEWLDAVSESLKPSTRQNYADYIRAYVDPNIGDRRLQDVTVPVLNLLYRHLLTAGRVKVDANARMFAYWSGRQDVRGGLGPTPAETVKNVHRMLHRAFTDAVAWH